MLKNKFSWVLFVSRRFANVDSSGRSAVTSKLASLGICFGVMTLIVVISVMNGFQMSFIDAIMEVSSYHVRVSNVDNAISKDFIDFCESSNHIKACVPFYEAQSLMVGRDGRQSAALVRALPPDVCQIDSGFESELEIVRGSFSLTQTEDGQDSIILGASLAATLGARVGSVVNLLALSGGNDVELLSDKRLFVVTGIYHTGYADINSSYAFVSLESGKKYFGSQANLIYGLKLDDYNYSEGQIHRLSRNFSTLNFESWKSYNRSFFGALRVEKTMLMLLVFLIFVVVCINIFNGMRRLVYERRNEISTLSALGGKSRMIQAIFIFRGFLTGIKGAFPGLVLGLLISIHMSTIFSFFSRVIYQIQYFFTMIVSPEMAVYIRENPMYLLYARIPARIIMHEVLIITVFGVFSALVASWLAGRGILKLKAAEVLRDE